VRFHNAGMACLIHVASLRHMAFIFCPTRDNKTDSHQNLRDIETAVSFCGVPVWALYIPFVITLLGRCSRVGLPIDRQGHNDNVSYDTLNQYTLI
jgi:hypothetical protein